MKFIIYFGVFFIGNILITVLAVTLGTILKVVFF